MSLTDTVKHTALALGFDAVGVALVQPRQSDPEPASTTLVERLRACLTDWLAAGYHATMTWMERAPERRADPRSVLPGCRSVIVVGLNYDTGARPDEREGLGRIARYAWGRLSSDGRRAADFVR